MTTPAERSCRPHDCFPPGTAELFKEKFLNDEISQRTRVHDDQRWEYHQILTFPNSKPPPDMPKSERQTFYNKKSDILRKWQMTGGSLFRKAEGIIVYSYFYRALCEISTQFINRRTPCTLCCTY